MKKHLIFSVFMCVSILVIVLVYSYCTNKNVDSFSLIDYECYLLSFPSEICVKQVNSANEAVQIAEEIWINQYGPSVIFKKPYNVSFDDTYRVWLVRGSLSGNVVGGVPYVLLHEDGQVLAVWHDK